MLDMDGVMTDGSIVFADSGEELKFFDVKDGHGIKLLMKSGIDVIVITARVSRAVIHRTDNLGIARSNVFEGVLDKLAVFEDILSKRGLGPEAVAFIGDDLMDLPIIKRAGISVAVSDAVKEVKAGALYVTARPG
ncbi:MAG: HAD hydrolase family protein, partial [Deltaproteobacteria bacterium]|nr:HAD hydrolase family protein [Deltaproteobacteria bacterium]